MKKGFISFIIYLVLFVGSGIITLTTYIDLEKANGGSEGFEALGLGILLALFIIVTIVLAVAFLFKIIHVATGWGFFGFLCSVIDLALIAVVAHNIYTSIPEGASFNFVESLPSLAVILALVVSFGSNVSSMKR